MRSLLKPGNLWRSKAQHHYVFKIIGVAIEGGGVSGAIVMYEQQGSTSYSWTTESFFLDNFEPDPNYGQPDLPAENWLIEE